MGADLKADLVMPPRLTPDAFVQFRAVCNICGGTDFIPGFLGRLYHGMPPCCRVCQSVERHRAVHRVYSILRPISSAWRVLHFAPDRSVEPTWFESYQKSVYGTDTSLDMMNTGLPDGSFDVVISNHVLEHVPDHVGALAETLRLVGPNGFVHLMVPAQAWTLDNWAFADPARNEHYREFGADFGLSIGKSLPGVCVIGVVAGDPVTSAADVIYLCSRSSATLQSIHRMLPRNGIQVARFF